MDGGSVRRSTRLVELIEAEHALLEGEHLGGRLDAQRLDVLLPVGLDVRIEAASPADLLVTGLGEPIAIVVICGGMRMEMWSIVALAKMLVTLWVENGRAGGIEKGVSRTIPREVEDLLPWLNV